MTAFLTTETYFAIDSKIHILHVVTRAYWDGCLEQQVRLLDTAAKNDRKFIVENITTSSVTQNLILLKLGVKVHLDSGAEKNRPPLPESGLVGPSQLWSRSCTTGWHVIVLTHASAPEGELGQQSQSCAIVYQWFPVWCQLCSSLRARQISCWLYVPVNVGKMLPTDI